MCNHFHTDLREDISDRKYCPQINESTDITALKLLDVSMIYRSTSLKELVSTHLKLFELKSCDPKHIVIGMKTLPNLNLMNPAAIGMDNCKSNGFNE